jgi:hypothetical protein
MTEDEAVRHALDEVERRIRHQADRAPVGSMAWRAHMADVMHLSDVRRALSPSPEEEGKS